MIHMGYPYYLLNLGFVRGVFGPEAMFFFYVSPRPTLGPKCMMGPVSEQLRQTWALKPLTRLVGKSRIKLPVRICIGVG